MVYTKKLMAYLHVKNGRAPRWKNPGYGPGEMEDQKNGGRRRMTKKMGGGNVRPKAVWNHPPLRMFLAPSLSSNSFFYHLLCSRSYLLDKKFLRALLLYVYKDEPF